VRNVKFNEQVQLLQHTYLLKYLVQVRERMNGFSKNKEGGKSTLDIPTSPSGISSNVNYANCRW
jgi:hypothetical protein